MKWGAMNEHANLTRRDQAVLLSLLGLAVFAPVLLTAAMPPPWLPEWLGAVIAVASLFAALLLFWRAGAMRARYIVLFAVALVIATALGQLLAHT